MEDRTVGACPFYLGYKSSQEELSNLYYEGLADIEEMKKLGDKYEFCSYYLSKQSLAEAQVICLPYVSLVDPGTRKSLNIELANSVIIFDEAHNLLEAIG